MSRPNIAGSVITAYCDLFGHLSVWWQIAAPPLAVMAGAALISSLLPADGAGGIFLFLSRTVVFAAMEAAILIGWTRAADSEFTVVEPSLNGEPTGAESRVLLWYVGLSLIFMGVLPAVLSLSGAAATVLMLVTAVVLLALRARLGFFFIEQALERPQPAATPWGRVSGGSYWALCAALLIAHCPFFVALALLGSAGQGDLVSHLAALLATLVLSALSPALTAGVVLAHWHAARDRPGTPGYSATVLT